MFTVIQTRVFIVLCLVITVLICFIGLNWERREDKVQVAARLDVPDIEPASFPVEEESRTVIETPAKVINLGEEEEIIEKKDDDSGKIYPGVLEDEGKTIILE